MIKDKLKACRMIEMEAKNTFERYERVRAIAERVSPGTFSHGASKSARKADGIGDNVVKIIELEEVLCEVLVRQQTLIEEVKSMIEELENNQRRIIHAYYIAGFTWKEVAKQNNYTEEHCWKLNRFALAALEKIDKCNQKQSG